MSSYWVIRKILRWLSVVFDQQCSGKYRQGGAVVYCKERAFHEDPCTDYQGYVFERPSTPAEPK